MATLIEELDEYKKMPSKSITVNVILNTLGMRTHKYVSTLYKFPG
jgi:hypothetical protein